MQNNTSLVSRIESVLAQRPIILQVLKFGCIGVLNTALDFVILFTLSKFLGISTENRLWYVNIISFSLAACQSYLWNKYWIFNTDATVSLFKNFIRLVVIGLLGTGALAAVLLGAHQGYTAQYFLAVFAAFIFLEMSVWFSFGLQKNRSVQAAIPAQFFIFVAVSAIGALINTVVLSYGVKVLLPVSSGLNADTVKFAAKIAATLFSLIWNFIGYKLIVFKKV